jgi:septation ring formation regulator EzrA
MDLTVISKKITDLKSQKQREQGQLELLKKQRIELEKQCEELGVTPETLPDFIQQKEEELADLTTELEKKVLNIENKKKLILSTD